jgi:hypothetical protein
MQCVTVRWDEGMHVGHQRFFACQLVYTKSNMQATQDGVWSV